MSSQTQKYYIYSLADLVYPEGYVVDYERGSFVPKYVREGIQSNISFKSVNEAFQYFLNAEGYDKELDGEFIFDTVNPGDEREEMISVGFVKFCQPNGNHATKEDIQTYNEGKIQLVQHVLTVVIYEYTCTALSLEALKKNILHKNKETK